MIYYDTGDIGNPRTNLAIEEYLLRNTRAGEDIFLLYINEPSIIIGRNQNAFEEFNKAYVEENQIPVVRRLSGGGTVYHDHGNVNFSFITDPGKDKFANFKYFTTPIIKALDRLGIKAELGERNEILVNGFKISGNAQYLAGKRMVSHGTLLYSTDLTKMEQALKVDRYSIKSKSIKSVRSQVTNICGFLSQPASIDTFQNHLRICVLETQDHIRTSHLNENDWQKVSKLVEERYQTWEWNYGNSPDFSVQKQGFYSGDKYFITLVVQRGIITNIQVAGKNNLPRELSQLQTLLLGVRYDKIAISNTIKEMDLPTSRVGFSAEVLLHLLH